MLKWSTEGGNNYTIIFKSILGCYSFSLRSDEYSTAEFVWKPICLKNMMQPYYE
jgi:hypothetical protein